MFWPADVEAVALRFERARRGREHPEEARHQTLAFEDAGGVAGREMTRPAVAVPGRIDVVRAATDGAAEALAAADGRLRRDQVGTQGVDVGLAAGVAKRAAMSASRGSASRSRSGGPSTRPRLMASSVARSSRTSSPRPTFDVIMPRTCAGRPGRPPSAQERIDQLVGQPLGVLAEFAAARFWRARSMAASDASGASCAACSAALSSRASSDTWTRSAVAGAPAAPDRPVRPRSVGAGGLADVFGAFAVNPHESRSNAGSINPGRGVNRQTRHRTLMVLSRPDPPIWWGRLVRR